MMRRNLGVIGRPISHSLSPLLHNFLIEKNGLDFSYHAFEVRPENLHSAIRGAQALGFRGLNVTIPHKVRVMDFVDELGDEAEQIGAVNTLIFEDNKIMGRNTDADGFLQSLAMENIPSLSKKTIFILGAGGAARAVVFAAKSAGAKRILITNRTMSRAEKLARDFGVEAVELQEIAALSEGGIVVNTTSVGMSPEVKASPLAEKMFREDLIYVDLVYNPRQTTFLNNAKKVGAKTVDGLGMLICQGATSLSLWASREIQTRDHFPELYALLRPNSYL